MALFVVGGATVFVFSGVMAMAGLGAAFLFVPLFYYLGVPLAQATSAALLLNAASLSVATVSYARAGLIDWRAGVPVLITAVILAPVGAALSVGVDRQILLGLFVVFLVFAGAMMLFYRPPASRAVRSPAAEAGVGAGVGGIAGFLGGLLGVGGGNIILPGLTWSGLDTKKAAGTTALAVVFSSLSGFLGHAALGSLDGTFLVVMAVLAAAGSFVGAYVMRTRLTSPQLKRSYWGPAVGHRRQDGARPPVTGPALPIRQEVSVAVASMSSPAVVAYRAKMQETQAELALLPEPDKIVTFDAVAAVVESLRAAIDIASPEQLRELIGMLVERIKVTENGDYEIEPVPAARPFFTAADSLLLAPPDGFEPPTPALGRLRSIH